MPGYLETPFSSHPVLSNTAQRVLAAATWGRPEANAVEVERLMATVYAVEAWSGQSLLQGSNGATIISFKDDSRLETDGRGWRAFSQPGDLIGGTSAVDTLRAITG
jgi:hypothetical protein